MLLEPDIPATRLSMMRQGIAMKTWPVKLVDAASGVVLVTEQFLKETSSPLLGKYTR